MDPQVYRLLHVIGLILLFVALGGACVQRGPRSMALHGIGLLLLLVGGFGLLAKLNIGWPWPGWVWLKVVGWVVLAVLPALARRAPQRAGVWLAVAVAVGAAGAWAAFFKPF